MNVPDPLKPTGWVPTNSTVAGGGLGFAAAQITIALLHYFKVDLSPETGASLAVIYTAAIGYFFPDGGRK